MMKVLKNKGFEFRENSVCGLDRSCHKETAPMKGPQFMYAAFDTMTIVGEAKVR
jgi:hypothetical protein